MKTRYGFVALGALGFAISAAHAELITFYNTANTFSWTAQNFFPQIAGRPLDITQDASQSNTANDHSLWRENVFHTTSNAIVPSFLTGDPLPSQPASNARFARSTTPFSAPGNNTVVFPVIRFNAGDVIGPALTWDQRVAYQLSSFATAYLPFERTFVGVEITLGDGVHYGFVEMNTSEFNAPVYSWGYETQPNTPFVVPAPGAAATLGLASLVARRRRRK